MRKNKFTRFYSSTSKIDATQFFLVIFKLFEHLILYPTTLNLVNIGTRNYFIITHTHTPLHIFVRSDKTLTYTRTYVNI